MSAADLAEERETIESSVPSSCRSFGHEIWARDAQLELPFGR
jgi:hypothetical protein